MGTHGIPSFLGGITGITHILGMKTLHFSWVLGIQGYILTIYKEVEITHWSYNHWSYKFLEHPSSFWKTNFLADIPKNRSFVVVFVVLVVLISQQVQEANAQTKVSHEKKTGPYFPLNPGWFLGMA